MKMKGTIPGRARGFSELLQGLLRQPSDSRNPLLKTSQDTRLFTDGVILFPPNKEEEAEVSKLHWDALAGDKEYQRAYPFPIHKLIPKYLGPDALSARHAGGTEEHDVVLVEGKDLEVLVEATPFLTLNSRYPNARWIFSAGEDYWQKPLVLIEKEGFSRGLFLGLIATVPVRRENAPKGFSEVRWKRGLTSTGKYTYSSSKKVLT